MLTVTEENVLVNVDAENKEEVIHILVDLLVKNGYVKQEYYDILVTREEQYPTGLPTGEVQVAIPHGIGDGSVLKPAIAIATLKHNVIFNNMCNKDEELSVGIVFLLALVSEHELAEDLDRVMSIFADSDSLSRLYAAKNRREAAMIMSELEKQVQ